MIKYQIIDTPLGDVVIGGREGKICFCHFALPSLEAALERVAADFPGEGIVRQAGTPWGRAGWYPEGEGGAFGGVVWAQKGGETCPEGAIGAVWAQKGGEMCPEGAVGAIWVQKGGKTCPEGADALNKLLCGRGSIFRWEDFLLRGTPLQLAVWREIYNLLPDELISYSALAARCGYPKAVRAVATAVGKNPISLIIPCHRVLRMEAFPKDWVKDGSICVESLVEKSGKKGSAVAERVDSMIDKEKLGNYEWGKELKRRILEWEGLI